MTWRRQQQTPAQREAQLNAAAEKVLRQRYERSPQRRKDSAAVGAAMCRLALAGLRERRP